jgi:vancomycin permeability regulator SanA
MILLRSILNSIFIIFIYLGIACIFIQGSGFNSKRWELTKNPNNVAVVLGAAVWSGNQPSPSLSGRIDRAVELFNNGMAGEIILTGGNAPGEKSEAEVAYEYAKRKGMKMSKVKTESLTTSTTEQMKYIKNKLADFEDINDIIVVSDAYHLVRVLEISKFFNIKILVAASRMELKDENKFYRQLRECIALMVFWSFAL